MNINKNNYEEYFIDYYDGNLSAEMVAELYLFLVSHPDLKLEFEDFSSISLDASSLKFPYKDQLKKEEINAANFSQYMIGAIEGDLNSSEIGMLDEYLNANPAQEKDYKLFLASKLTPTDEVYPYKRELKKAVPMVFNFSNTMKYAVAAILLLAFIGGMYFTFIRSNEKVINEFAEATEKSNEKNNSIDKVASETDKLENDSVKIETTNSVEKFSDPISLPIADKINQESKNKNKYESNKKIKSSDKATNHFESLPVATVDGIQIDKVYSNTPEQNLQMNSPVAQSTFTAEPVAEEEYLSVWEALRQASERKLQKAGSNDSQELASTDENISPRKSVKNIIEKSIEKVSNDKVAINTEGDLSSSTSRFSLALGNFKIEKDRLR